MLIEDALAVSARFLTEGYKSGGFSAFVVPMMWSQGFRVTAYVELEHDLGRGYAKLVYSLKDEPITQEIALVTQKGIGRRWFIVCSRIHKGKPCGRLAAKIYLAEDKFFGCNECQRARLRYRSEKPSKANRLAKDPRALKKALADCKTIAEKRQILDAYLVRRDSLRRKLTS